jgi:hypothetical protein
VDVALASYRPKLAICAGGLTLAAAAAFKKSWVWWMVGALIFTLGLFFQWNNENTNETKIRTRIWNLGSSAVTRPTLVFSLKQQLAFDTAKQGLLHERGKWNDTTNLNSERYLYLKGQTVNGWAQIPLQNS